MPANKLGACWGMIFLPIMSPTVLLAPVSR